MNEPTPPIVVIPVASPTDTRARLLEAGWRLVGREGFANLTLDAVAKEAAVSKGGLLYHFPSKRALLEGMVEQRCNHFEREVERHAETERGRGRWLRALVKAASSNQAIPSQDGAAAFALLANDPNLLELVRKRRLAFQQQIDLDGIDPAQAALIRLAVDGMCFNQIMGFGTPPAELREQVVARLLDLASEKCPRNESTRA